MEVSDLIIILNLVVLESLLSVDNAAVMAIMVKDLPGKQKQRALRYGILGAYVFRGLSLLLVSWLMNVVWLKILGGLYLCYLFIGHLTKRVDTLEEGVVPRKGNRLSRYFDRKIGHFWSVVILVNLMDLAFSIDNVFAAVALSDKFWVVMTGVAIGILAIRLVAVKFVKLMEKFPQLEWSAYLVILILGLKLCASGIIHYIPCPGNCVADTNNDGRIDCIDYCNTASYEGGLNDCADYCKESIDVNKDGQLDCADPVCWSKARRVMEAHNTDLIFSGSVLVLFVLPLLFRRKQKAPKTIDQSDTPATTDNEQ
jgi:YkoY family integral membrane protein